MRPFDPIATPLQGSCLIEAGAGTGKTYTIATLVLRLVLQQGFTPEQILVVTFTTAATAELRDRLRGRFRDAKSVLQGQARDDDTLRQLLSACGPRERSLRRLEDALANFDRMPVFTIHGFCQRVLTEMAFETGSGFDTELVAEAAPIVQDLAEDFWRTIWHQTPPEVVAFAQAKLKAPESLASLYRLYGGPEIALLPDAETLPTVSCDNYRSLWSQAREQWRGARETILEQLAAPDLKATSYGHPDRPAGDLGGPSKREAKLRSWGRLVDRWVRSSVSAFPPPEVLVYFTRSKLKASLKKGGREPKHAFFATCDHLWQEYEHLSGVMDQWLVILKVHFFHYLAGELRRYKREREILFFDDLLLMVRDALKTDAGSALQQRLQARYRAALIDEFQDTDSVQYTIFTTLFGGGDPPLFMIGDPKQAIYSFRGADIFTYLAAARQASQRYTLTVNWRSTPGMIRAVNALFGRSTRPFLWPDIVFQPATAARHRLQASENSRTSAALTIWYLADAPQATGKTTWTKQTASEIIAEGLAREIRRIAASGECGPEKWRYQDMAVLVRTNRQARDVKEHLNKAGLPAVVYHAGSVFESSEALELQRLLEAAADPGNEGKLRTAHCSPFLGRRGDELDFAYRVPAWWEETLERFYGYRARWIEKGFIHMFRRLLLQEQVAPRLLAAPSGERSLTNLLHLVELLHQASVARGLGPAELIQWLAQQRLLAVDSNEAHQLRLESDAEAVTIMTVHKSKGLEFPVVFCPFAWEGMRLPSAPALCHTDRYGDQRLLDFGSAHLDRHLAQMAEERMAEELRLLYVAVTRAKQRCYLAWGRLSSSGYSALGYLLNPESLDTSEGISWKHLQSLAHALGKQTPADHRGQVMKLVRHSRGTISMTELSAEPFEPLSEGGPSAELVPARVFGRYPFPNWKITSFSALVGHRPADGEIQEARSEHQDGLRASVLEIDRRPSAHIGAMADFEAGPRAGLMFHDILEHIDFSLSGTGQWEAIVADRLQAHGFGPQWQTPVLDLLCRVLQAPLTADGALFFALQEVGPQDRINEMAFHLPLRAFNAASLAGVFAGCRVPLLRDEAPRLLEQRAFSLEGGFLKGYIDLVFRHGGRYFLVDWKSNLLGDTFAAYRSERLNEVMLTESYYLQYHLYALAVDRFLAAARPDYSYHDHFGGVFYCFIRGMGATPAGTSQGVYFDRPREATMEQLRQNILF